MSPHPCADHMATCDHCYSCDVLGICCCSSAARAPAVVDAAIDDVLTEKLILAAEHDRLVGSDLARAFSADALSRVLCAVADRPSHELADAMQADLVRRRPSSEPQALPVASVDFETYEPMEVNRARPR